MALQSKKTLLPLTAAVSLLVGAGVAYGVAKWQQGQNGQPKPHPPQPKSQPKATQSSPPQPANAVEQPKPGLIMKYGWPGLENLKVRQGYVMSYDRSRRNAHWSCERLSAQQIGSRVADRSACEFYEDKTENELFRATLSDYRRSGYDRGHLAAAGNHNSNQEQMCETFALSNMSPQVGKGFNRDYWRHLEEHIRSLTRHWDQVYVCTGPLYLPHNEADGKKYVKYEVIGGNNVAVPTHFFKTVLLERGSSVEIQAYIVPNAQVNSTIPLEKFRVPLQEVENASGHLFYDGLPDRYRHVKV